jgi:UDPglucose 6-dehydrogenase
MTVGVLGLGKLGLPFALTLAAANHSVMVWDVDPRARDAVAAKKMHIDEPRVADMLESQNRRLTVAEPLEISYHADVVFVVVPTPSLGDGSFDASLALAAIDSLTNPCVVALVSTVSPGTCRGLLLPAVRQLEHQLVYTPTLIALGSVVEDLTTPDLQLVGGTFDTPTVAGQRVAQVLRSVAPTAPQFYMSYESAEISKLAMNVFATLKIGFVNQLGQLADGYGANIDQITRAISHGRNVAGTGCLTAGAGFGGPCYPRDGRAFGRAGGSLGHFTHELNDQHAGYFVERAVRVLDPGIDVNLDTSRFSFAVLGHAYKEGSNYQIEPWSKKLTQAFVDWGLKQVPAPEADVVAIAQPLREINLCDQVHENAVVLDLWRTHPYFATCEPPVRYVPFGARSHNL